MRMVRRGDRYYSSEQALNKLLSIQCAFLEQRDETLNGVLHTLLLLGRGHAATITADAHRDVRRPHCDYANKDREDHGDLEETHEVVLEWGLGGRQLQMNAASRR